MNRIMSTALQVAVDQPAVLAQHRQPGARRLVIPLPCAALERRAYTRRIDYPTPFIAP